MSFWGLSSSGSEAKGFPSTIGNFDFGQYKNWLGQANDSLAKGNDINNNIIAFWKNRATQPLPTVSGTQGTGNQILPWQPVVNTGMDRLSQIMQDYLKGVNPAATTGGNISSLLDTQAGDITRTGDQVANEINTSAANMQGQNSSTWNDIINNFITQGGNLRTGLEQGYGGLQSNNAALSKVIDDTLGSGFTNAFSELEKTRPTGEFQAATAARSFAPAAANVMRRLRASGIDPNSPEGIAAMSGVNEQKARAMDDAIGSSAERFAKSMADLNLAKGGALAGAKTDELGRLLGFGKDQISGSTAIGANILNAVPGMQESGLNTSLGIESGRNAAVTGNLRDTLSQAIATGDKRVINEQLTRAMQQQDWGTVADIMGQMNQQDLLGLNLGNQAFGQGVDWNNMLKQQEADPYNQLQQVGQTNISNALAQAQLGKGFGSDALQAMLAKYGIELPNSGWGTKLLSGMASPFIGKGTDWITQLLNGLGGGGNTAAWNAASP